MSNSTSFEPNLTIEDKIRLDLNNKQLYLEYADWLLKNNQPELANFITKCCKIEYFPAVLTWDPKKQAIDEEAFSIIDNSRDVIAKFRKWRYGFVQNLQISCLRDIDTLNSIFQFPFFRFLESLTIGYENLPKLFEFLKDWKGLKYIKRLNLWDYNYYDGLGMGDLNTLLPKLKHIHYLYLVGSHKFEFVKEEETENYKTIEVEVENFNLPELIHFARMSNNLTKKELDNITNGTWPKLEALSIGIGFKSELVAEDFIEFLNSPNLKSVNKLAIQEYVDMDNLIELLVNSPLLSQLKRLSFYNSNLSSKGAQTLLKNKDKLLHIEEININCTILTEDSEAKLVAAFPSIKSNNRFREKGEGPIECMIYGSYFWEDLPTEEDWEDMDPF